MGTCIYRLLVLFIPLGVAGASQAMLSLACARLQARTQLLRLLLEDVNSLAADGHPERFDALIAHAGGTLSEPIDEADLYATPDPRRPIRIERRSPPCSAPVRLLSVMTWILLALGSLTTLCGGLPIGIVAWGLAAHSGLCAVHLAAVVRRVQAQADRVHEEVLRWQRAPRTPAARATIRS